MTMVFAVGSNKKGELGIGDNRSCSCFEPIHLYVYDGIYESEEYLKEDDSEPSTQDIPESLQHLVSKIPDGISVRPM